MNCHEKLDSCREILAEALALGGYADAGPSGSVFSQEPERQLTTFNPAQCSLRLLRVHRV